MTATTTAMPAIGTRIEATCAPDSFYKKVRGIVTGHRNGRVQMKADEVISKWGKTWEKHPTSCAMGVSPADIVTA